ncbi:hypothetical protein D3C81_1686580 [compost metagenome]
MAGRRQADYPADAGHGGRRVNRPRRSSSWSLAQFDHYADLFFYCLSVRRASLPMAVAVCHWINAFNQRLYSAWRIRPALCDDRLRRIAYRYLHHAGHVTVRSVVSAADTTARRGYLVQPADIDRTSPVPNPSIAG